MNRKSPTSATTASNRRNFFRINQDVIFHCRPADHYQANQGLPEAAFDDAENVDLATQLSQLNHQADQTLKILADKDRDLGDYLRLLNSKIDLIARRALVGELAGSQAAARINLSEAGIAFESTRAYYKGTFLAIRLIFLPSYSSFTGFARIVRCESRGKRKKTTGDARRLSDADQTATEGTESAKPDTFEMDEVFEVAARFHRLTEQNRQVLAREIMQAQIAARSKQRQDVSNEDSH